MCRLLLIVVIISSHHQFFSDPDLQTHTHTQAYPPPPRTAPPPPPLWPPPPPSLEHKTNTLIFCLRVKSVSAESDEFLPSIGAIETVVVRRMTITTTSRFLSGQSRAD